MTTNDTGEHTSVLPPLVEREEKVNAILAVTILDGDDGPCTASALRRLLDGVIPPEARMIQDHTSVTFTWETKL